MTTQQHDAGGTRPGPSRVGIVVVSHSRALARAAVALASEMLHGRTVKFAIAAGLDETTFGTDAVRIKEAIEEVDGPDGVVVLMDLGSAVLSAELALDLLTDPTTRDRVVLSPAPVVEGLVVAAVAAAGGAGRLEVAAEARGALLGKAAHLSTPDVDHPASDELPGPEVAGLFTVTNRHGLHARPAARLVGELRGLDAAVRLRNVTTGTGPVPGSSLTKVATLGVLQGHQVEISASGPQAHEAVEHALALAERRFDEPDDEQLTDVQAMRREVAPNVGALPASPGIAIGPARLLRRAPVAYAAEFNRGPDAEWRALVEAVAEVRRDIERVRVLAAREVGAAEASIFDAHLMLLGDSAMLADVKRRINGGEGAPTAWDATVNEVEAQWAALEDPYLRARADDVRAVGEQVLRAMTGTVAATVDGEGILVARDLTPADTAQLDRERVHGIVLAYGSPSSHAAILARSRGIPAVVNAGAGVLSIADGATLVIDGSSGELVIDPTAEELQRFEVRAAEQRRRSAQQLARAAEPAVTRDSIEIEVAANLGAVGDARVALASGADAAGLVRTEFLFLGRDSAPSVDEQEAEYVAIGEALGGRRITLRTLDVGGDKPLPYIAVPVEANPFLGRRGIRLSLERSDLMSDQLRAICQAARRTPVSVMFPMITTVSELLEARRLLDAAAGPDGRPGGLRVGIMVEVPAAALKIETFLPYLDFVSIGTNDLTQYTLAAERGNPALAALSDALDPGVLQLIAHVCRAANGRVPVGVCGEAASDPVAVGVLLGLGVRELSVGAGSVPGVKAAVRELDLGECRTVAEKALSLRDASEVRHLVTGG